MADASPRNENLEDFCSDTSNQAHRACTGEIFRNVTDYSGAALNITLVSVIGNDSLKHLFGFNDVARSCPSRAAFSHVVIFYEFYLHRFDLINISVL